jgi:ABC-2 type transport system permease protein
MSSVRQVRLVALREMRERSRSRGFQIGLVAMLLIVVAVIALPPMFDSSPGTRDVGFAGSTAPALAAAVAEQADAVAMTVRVHDYDTVPVGEQAVRDGDIDVLVVDGTRLEWLREPDADLQALVTGAIQVVAIHERAEAAGVDPDDVLALVAPVAVENVELGVVTGRGDDDEAAAFIMSVLLLAAIATYGNLVLTGVVEEKASRVVEVLLARMPARALLAGKVAGIGLLGVAQFAVTAIAALVTIALVDDVDLPGVSADVVAWVVVWFVLGYAIYATTYGTLGSLASRVEDAQAVAGPVVYVLLAAYWASYIAVVGDPDSTWSVVASLFPLTAPFAMPARLALGVAAWWEPLLAAVLTIAAIAALVMLAGRVYTRAILHAGARLRLRDVLREPPSARAGAAASDDGVDLAVGERPDRQPVGLRE